MSERNRRRWWKAAALLIVGGGGWLGFVQAQPPREPLPKEESAVWKRSVPLGTPPAPAADPVTPAAATTPAVPPLAAPPVALPPLPSLPDVPKAPAPLPPGPATPLIPPIPLAAPPAPPSKVAEPAKPTLPAGPGFNLHPENVGNSVKTDGPTVEPPRAIAPPPTLKKDVFPVPAKPVALERTAPTRPDTLASTPGDLPMMSLKQTAVAAVIGGAIALAPSKPAAALPIPVPLKPAVPVAADPKDEKDTRTTDQKLADIDKKLADLTELMKGRKDSAGFPVPSDPGLIAEVKKLKDEIAALKTQIQEMQKSTSLRPGTGTTGLAPSPTDPLANKGFVRVVNDYKTEITIVVNNQSYRVAAGTELRVPVPAGEFTYQLLNDPTHIAPIRSTVEATKTVTLRVK